MHEKAAEQTIQEQEQQQEGPLFNFTNSLDNANTRDKYLLHLNNFLRRNDYTDVRTFLSLPIGDLERKIVQYLVGMKAQNLSSSYIRLSFSAIKHICIMNDVRINKEKISKFIGSRTELHHDRPYENEEILQLLNVCDLRLKVIILLLASTGMRVGALPTLKIGHISGQSVTVYADSPERYITFMTFECRKAIDDYLEFRTRSGEKITAESFVLREKFDKNDLEQVKKRGRQMTVKRISNMMRDALVECGLRTVNHNYNGRQRHEVTAADGFRKFFTNRLIDADIKTEHRWLLEGHRLKANDSYYVRTSEKTLYAAYEKAIDLLTIDPTKRMARKIQKLEVERSQMDMLAQRLQQLEATVHNHKEA